MAKKIGGVRITLTPVTNLRNSEFRIVSGNCVCGKPKQQCNAEWDEKLGIIGHAADSQSGISQYERNRQSIANAIVQGLDPFCSLATALAEGYDPHWTPHRPAGSFSVPTQSHAQGETSYGKRGQKSDKGSGHKSGRGSGQQSRGKRR